jgi:hypothetical protein
MSKRFFRRKSSTTATPSDLKPNAPTPRRAFLGSMPSVTAADIAVGTSPDFAKLRAWLLRHPDTTSHITLYRCTEPPSDAFQRARQLAIKSQLSDGFSLLLKSEKCLRESIPAIPRAHPFAAGASLSQVADLWHVILRYELQIESVMLEIDGCVRLRFDELRVVVAKLLCFLAAIDAVPLTVVPSVTFPFFSASQIVAADERALKLRSLIPGFRKLIDETRAIVADIAVFPGEELQAATLHTLLGQCRVGLDVGSRMFAAGFAPTTFLDFLRHPGSRANTFLRAFLDRPTLENFRQISEKVIDQLDIRSFDECIIINAALSGEFASLCSPAVKADGPGTDDESVLRFAIDLFVNHDPLVLLKSIADRVNLEDVRGCVQAAADALRTLTSGWQDILVFVFEFSNEQYLSGTMTSVRFVLGQFLKEDRGG